MVPECCKEIKLNLTPDQIEFLQFFKEHFKGNGKVVPKHWINKSGKSGYSPLCNNFYKKGVCPKCINKQHDCDQCSMQDRIAWNDDLLIDHFKGNIVLGIYPLDMDTLTCWFIAGDFDNHSDDLTINPLNDVKKFYKICEKYKIPCYVFRSKSGKGYHVYIFFREAISALNARLFVLHLAEEAGIVDAKWNKLSTFDNFFPVQHYRTKKRLGNAIGLPFQGKAYELGNTQILDPHSDFSQPYADQLSIIKNIQKIDANTINQYANDVFGTSILPNKFTPEYKRNNHNNQYTGHKLIINPDKLGDINVSASNFILRKFGKLEINQGSRYDTLFKTGCSLWSRGYEMEDIRECLIKINDGNCQPPHSETEIDRILDGVGSYVQGELIVTEIDKNEIISELLNHAKDNPKKLIETIGDVPEYMGTLGLIAKVDNALYESTLSKIRNLGVAQKNIETIRRMIKSQLKRPNLQLVSSDYKQPLIPIKSVLADAPVEDNLMIPNGYKLAINGIHRVGEEDNFILVPIITIERIKNLSDGTESAKLSWFRDGKWNHHIVEKKLISNSGSIYQLSNFGIPITNLDSISLVKYLKKFEEVNNENIPIKKVTNNLGWQNNLQNFLLGTTIINETDNISFFGKDGGNDQIASAFTTAGSFDIWVETENKLFEYPIAMVMSYFSLSVPFLHIFKFNSFIVDLANETSKGKTIVLRVAGSCWGNPNETGESSVVHTWNATKVWIERTAAILNGLPLIMDDTKLAGTGTSKENAAKMISQTIYQIASGRGKGRGSVSGTRGTGSWRTILLSTGEQSIVDFAPEHGGSVARVVSIWGLPFGKADQETGEFVKEINTNVKENYGHAGLKVIQFIENNRDKWNLWKKEFASLQKKFAKLAGDNSVANRISDYFAFLATVIPIIHAAIPELRRDIPPLKIIKPVWDIAISVADEADKAAIVLQKVYGWAVSNQHTFWHRHTTNTDGSIRVPVNGWSGTWEKENWKYIGFSTNIVNKILSDNKYDVNHFLQIWKERNWLETDPKGRGKTVRINREHDYCYCIKKEAIDKVMNFETS